MRTALILAVILSACSAFDGGRTLTGPGGVMVQVPAGAVKSTAALGLAVANEGFPALPSGSGSTVFALTPHGQTFAVPVTLTFPATASQSRLLTAQPGGAWAAVPGVRRVGNTLVAEVSHFSFFVVSEPSPPRVVFGDGWAVRELDMSDGGVTTLVDGVAGQNFVTSVAVDDQRRVYWFDNATDALSRLDADGTKRVLYTSPQATSNPEGLAVDPVHGLLFWAEGGTVMRAQLDGSGGAAFIAPTSGAFASSVAIDAAGGFVYWTDNGSDTVNRAALDGSGRTVLHTAPDAFANPRALALDVAAQMMFWGEGTSLLRAPLAGGPATVVASGTLFITSIAVDAESQQLYWTDNASDALMRARYDGSGLTQLYSSPLWSPGGLGNATNPNGVTLR